MCGPILPVHDDQTPNQRGHASRDPSLRAFISPRSWFGSRILITYDENVFCATRDYGVREKIQVRWLESCCENSPQSASPLHSAPQTSPHLVFLPVLVTPSCSMRDLTALQSTIFRHPDVRLMAARPFASIESSGPAVSNFPSV